MENMPFLAFLQLWARKGGWVRKSVEKKEWHEPEARLSCSLISLILCLSYPLSPAHPLLKWQQTPPTLGGQAHFFCLSWESKARNCHCGWPEVEHTHQQTSSSQVSWINLISGKKCEMHQQLNLFLIFVWFVCFCKLSNCNIILYKCGFCFKMK